MSSQQHLNYLVEQINSGQWDPGSNEGELAVTEVIKLLDSNQYRVRAMWALGEIKEYRAINPLIKLIELLDKSDYRELYAAGEALKKIGFNPRDPYEKVMYAFAIGKEEELINSGKSIVDPLITILKNKNAIKRVYAASLLGEMGENKAIAPLINVLVEQDEDDKIKSYAVKSLGKLGAKKAIIPIVKYIAESFADKSSHSSYNEGIEALGEIGNPSIPHLKMFLTHEDVSGISINAAETLKKLGWVGETPEDRVNLLIPLKMWDEVVEIGEPAVEPLINAFNSGRGYLYGWLGHIARSLGKIGDERAIKVLLLEFHDLLKDGCFIMPSGYKDRANNYWDLVSGIRDALSCFGDLVTPDLLVMLNDEKFRNQRSVIFKTLEKIGSERATKPIVDHVKKHKSRANRTAILALGKTNDPKATEVLLETIRDAGEEVPVDSIRALGERKDPHAMYKLIELLDKTEGYIIDEVAKALSRIGDSRALEPLIINIPRIGPFWPSDDTVDPRGDQLRSYGNREYSKAILSFGSLATVMLIKYIKDKNSERRYRCAFLLESTGWSPTTEEEEFNFNYALKWWNELKKYGKRAVYPLFEALKETIKDEDPFFESILWPIIDIKEYSLGPTIELLSDNDPRIRTVAALAIGKMEDEKGLDALVNALSDEAPTVREEAKRAIIKIGGPAAKSLLNNMDD